MVLQLCPNIDIDQNIEVACRVAQNLSAQGVRCVADEVLRPIVDGCDAIEWMSRQQADDNCDYFVAIGGDGTTLRTAQRAIEQDKPIFAVNTGRVGFLAAFDSESADDITPQAIQSLQQRNRLLLDFSLESKPDAHRYAVNDVVIQRSVTSNTIEVGIEYGQYTVGRIRADGIIVATPTGSTAYSLSAGGPIVAPGVGAFVITPICAHNLAVRSYVLGARDTVRITLTERDDNLACILLDGMTIGELDHRDAVIIKLGQKYLKLLASEKRSFYGILNRELSEKDV